MSKYTSKFFLILLLILNFLKLDLPLQASEEKRHHSLATKFFGVLKKNKGNKGKEKEEDQPQDLMNGQASRFNEFQVSKDLPSVTSSSAPQPVILGSIPQPVSPSSTPPKDQPLVPTFPEFWEARIQEQTNQQTESPRKAERTKNPKHLYNIRDHRNFLRRCILKATTSVTITSRKVCESFVEKSLFPWFSAIEKRNLQITIYTTDKGYQTILKVMRRLEDTDLARKSEGKYNSPSSPREDLSRQHNPTSKATNLDLIICPTVYCGSNVVYCDEMKFVNSPFPWLSTNIFKEKLNKDTLYFARIERKLEAKLSGDNFFNSLDMQMRKEQLERRDHSALLNTILDQYCAGYHSASFEETDILKAKASTKAVSFSVPKRQE